MVKKHAVRMSEGTKSPPDPWNPPSNGLGRDEVPTESTLERVPRVRCALGPLRHPHGGPRWGSPCRRLRRDPGGTKKRYHGFRVVATYAQHVRTVQPLNAVGWKLDCAANLTLVAARILASRAAGVCGWL